MNIDFPTPQQLPQLKQLYQNAFGDSDAQVHLFFSTAYAPERCRCITVSGRLAAAHYWLDCEDTQGKIAYLYAVATDPAFRNQGLCHKLMEDTHRLLASQGYRATVLVPGSASLFSLYASMGYKNLNCIETVTCDAGIPIDLTPLSVKEYTAARRQYLPQGGIIQEKENLSYLSGMAQFYGGESFVLAGYLSGSEFVGLELLGHAENAPGIIAALGAATGHFRVPGNGPFAMYKMLVEDTPPRYFGLALD